MGDYVSPIFMGDSKHTKQMSPLTIERRKRGSNRRRVRRDESPAHDMAHDMDAGQGERAYDPGAGNRVSLFSLLSLEG